MDLDITNYSDEEIAALCNDNDCEVIGDVMSGRRIVKLSPTVVVKSGWSVTPDEAANQEYAYSCKSDLKIPKVYRYFRLSGIGYLVMEFIDGKCLERIPQHQHFDLIPRLARAIHSLTAKVTPESLGPKNGGCPRGYLFSEDGAGQSLSSIADLNLWLNKRARLGVNEPGFTFQLSDCAFCHLDLARRNILLLPNQKFGLLDWEHAGFYPRVFESYCLQFVGQNDYEFSRSLMKSLDDISPNADSQTEGGFQIRMLDRVYRNNLKYNFSSPTNHVELRMLVESEQLDDG